MGGNESTIRSHMERVFARHGLSGQAQLVLFLAGTSENRR